MAREGSVWVRVSRARMADTPARGADALLLGAGGMAERRAGISLGCVLIADAVCAVLDLLVGKTMLYQRNSNVVRDRTVPTTYAVSLHHHNE